MKPPIILAKGPSSPLPLPSRSPSPSPQNKPKSLYKYVVPSASIITKIGSRYISDAIVLKRPKVFSEWLCDYLIELGPVFVKIGQTLSTRKDFISPDLVESLQRLQNDVTPFTLSLKDICNIVEDHA